MRELVDYAMQFVGVPYKFGGSHPADGLDCSGLVQIILQAAGIDPPGDQTAQGLYNFFESRGSRSVSGAGTLCFYGESVTKISHVAFQINPYQIIEAAGAGSEAKTRVLGIASNAFVRIRLTNYRSDLVAQIKPSYTKIGYI